MVGIPWPKLSSDLPPTFEAPATPHSFLDCCRPHSTAIPSPQYIIIAANFFTHASNKARFKVNINLNTPCQLFIGAACFELLDCRRLCRLYCHFFRRRAIHAAHRQQVRPQWRPGNVPWDCLLWFRRRISPATINWPGARTPETIVNNRGCTGEFSTKKMFSKLFFYSAML